jgi:lipopolysaccharide export system protein LptA
MQFSIKKLRWVLLAGALVLIAVLTAFIGYGRYRAMALYLKLIKHSGATISHDTSGFTYSQTEKGKTIFTLHASKATQVGDGKWSLHNVSVKLYGHSDNPAANRTDYITGSEFTYDEKEGIVRAIGEVHMDLQAPQSLTSAGHTATEASGANTPPPATTTKTGDSAAPAPEAADVVHVRTSGLVYLRNLVLPQRTSLSNFTITASSALRLGRSSTPARAQFVYSQTSLLTVSCVTNR